MSTSEVKRVNARARFWKPFISVCQDQQVCGGMKNYPSLQTSGEEFEERMQWLRDNLRPLLKEVEATIDNEALILKYMIMNKTHQIFPETHAAKKKVHKVWRARPTGKVTKSKLDEVVDVLAQEVIDGIQKSPGKETAGK